MPRKRTKKGSRSNRSNTNAKLESPAELAPQPGDETQRLNSPLRLVVTHYRSRLCDYDNLSIKAALDAFRYAGVVPGDEAQQITEIVHRQVKSRIEKTVFRFEEQ